MFANTRTYRGHCCLNCGNPARSPHRRHGGVAKVLYSEIRNEFLGWCPS